MWFNINRKLLTVKFKPKEKNDKHLYLHSGISLQHLLFSSGKKRVSNEHPHSIR